MSDTGPIRNASGARRDRRLTAEFAGLFVLAPVAGAVALPPDEMFAMLFAITGLGLALLHVTPGFRWRELAQGWGRIDWPVVAAIAGMTALAGYGIVLATAPEAAFFLLRELPGLMLAIVILYPILSALPQEIVFRPLFFRRYGPILPAGAPAVWLNAGIFALAHLMYWSWITAAMTFAGGLVFAHAYRTRGFPTAVTAHAAAGIVVFLVGLGIHFYSGNVTRPF